MKELSQNLGSAFGRLITETMNPIVRRSLELMNEMGMIDLPLKIDGLQVQILPTSPLAMAGNMDRVNDVMSFMQISQSLGPVGQTLIKQDAVGDYLADLLSIPASLRTTPQERAQMQQQMLATAQAMAQQQGMDTTQVEEAISEPS